MKLTKLGQRGFDHIAIMAVFVLLFGIAGSYLLIRGDAAAWSGSLEIGGPTSGYCMSTKNGSTNYLTQAVLNTCNNQLNQKWQLAGAGTYQHHSVFLIELNAGSASLCINNVHGSFATYTPLYLTGCRTSAAGERFMWSWTNRQTRELVALQTGHCIGDYKGSKEANNKLDLNVCATTHNWGQKWYETINSYSPPNNNPAPTGSGGNSSGGTTSSSLGGCTSNSQLAPCIGNLTTGASGWGTPIFDDEFSQDSSLNTKTWSPDWFGNGNVENETTMLASNVNVSGGNLNLLANGSNGGLVSTNPNDGQSGHTGFQFTYGFAEARIFLPAGGNNQIANWPAWWTDGQNWPTDGEDDIIEGLHGEICWHFPTAPGNPGGCDASITPGWHTFASDWEPGKVTYYYDGVDVASISNDITSVPMYLILENSTGNSSGPLVSPATMKVQYVRVWQK